MVYISLFLYKKYLYFWIALWNLKPRIIESCPCTAGNILAVWPSRGLSESKCYENETRRLLKAKGKKSRHMMQNKVVISRW
jgi:hypothetical protein